MNLSELKRQRELVAQHLAWLDQQIEESPLPNSSVNLSPKETTQTEENFEHPLEPIAPPASTLPPPSPSTPKAPSPETLSATSKLGCWIVGSLIIGAILFVFLGLPYFLYD